MSRLPKQAPTITQKHPDLRKANPEIGFRITSGQLSFLGRKIYNVLLYRSQQLKMVGKGKFPHALAYEPANFGIPTEGYWWIPLSDLIDDAATGSNNHARVKEYLRSLMTVLVERNAAGWEADHIIDKVRIIGTQHPDGNARGDKLLVGWKFPDELEEDLIAPNEYTRFSLYYQSQLKTEAALVLYEVCKRYLTSPTQRTGKMTWQEWQERLMTSRHDEYKIFKRDVLNPSIKEVNAITDIFITLVEHRGDTRGRPVEAIQFNVDPNKQINLELPSGPAIPGKLLSKLEELGISPIAAEKMLSVHGEEKVMAAVDHVAQRIANNKLPALASPAAYLRKAIADDFAGGEAALKKAKAGKALEADEKARQRKTESERKLAAELVPAPALPEGEALASAWAEFCAAPESAPARLGKALPESYDKAKKAAQAAFKLWLTKR